MRNVLHFIRQYDKVSAFVILSEREFLRFMKSNILKFIFILSFIPYILILYSILFSGYIVNDIELQGTKRLLRSIVSHFHIYVYVKPIIPTCLTFQMCYIFRKKTKIMFICSFIPYLFVLLLALLCAIFGDVFLGETVYYGFDGFELGLFKALIYYIIGFPILPICLIFQVGYIIIKLKRIFIRKNNL